MSHNVIASLLKSSGSVRTSRRTVAPSVPALEPRTLLATLVNPSKVTYQDADGDNVEVTFGKSFLTAGNVNSIFTFDTGSVNGSNAAKQQLVSLNLSGITGAAGTTIVTKSVRSPATGGDGFAAIGQIDAGGIDLGAVTIDGDLGRIVAGDFISATQGVGTLTVHSLGRFGDTTGALNLVSSIQGPLLSLKVKTDVKHVTLAVTGTIGTISIGGSLIGGDEEQSGRISSFGDMGAVSILGDLIGGDGANSGQIFSSGKLASVTIGGALIGDDGLESGRVASSLSLGAVKVAGDVIGGDGEGSGSIRTEGTLASVTIGGSLIGGDGTASGSVFSGANMGAVVISRSVLGDEDQTGRISTDADLLSVTIGGVLSGGDGVSSGRIDAGNNLGTVKIAGDLLGGDGNSSGGIRAGGKLTSATIGGSVIGGDSTDSGRIHVVGELTTLTINGNLVGGSASGSDPLERSGNVTAGRIGTLTLGSLIAGHDNTFGAFANNGAIRVSNDIATATIKGSLIGNSSNRALITARGHLSPSTTSDQAIGKLTINGRVEFANISLGFDPAGFMKNADAQIGPVVVGHDWIASNLIVGAITGIDGKFGTADDVKMSGSGVKDVSTVFSKVTSLVIGGQAFGTPSGSDHFGIVAQNIASFKVKGGTTTFPMIAGNGNDDFLVGLLGDFRVNEIA